MKLNTYILTLNKFTDKIDGAINENPYTKVYGLARSIIALSTLSIFLFNDLDYLYNEEALNVLSSSEFIFNKINLFGILTYENLLISKIISIIILLFVISGYFPRVSGILHFWIVYSFHNSCILLDGGDQIATILTFLIIPLSIFDNRKNHWYSEEIQNGYSKLIGHITFKIISIQVSFIYLNTAIEKLYKLSEWKDGTAIYYIFSNSYFGLNNFFLNLLSPIINSKFVFIITWWVVLSHLILSYILLLERKKKINYIVIGFIFHLGIAVFMGLYSFGFTMIGALILYILPFNYLNKWKIKKYILKKNKFSTSH